MNDRTQYLKCGTITRLASIKSLEYEELPRDVRKYLSNHGPYFDSETSVKFQKFYYNGGGNLVNYGFNTFIRDIYCIRIPSRDITRVIYSDRFGKYYQISDNKISEIIYSANLCVSAEGVLLFYDTKEIMYATLNCKAGTIINISELLRVSKCFIKDIFVSDGKTFIEIEDKNGDKDCYGLSFTFNLFESYGTQIYVEAFKVKGNKTDILNNKVELYDKWYCEIEKAKRELLLSRATKIFTLKEFKKTFEKSEFCNTNEKLIPDDSFKFEDRNQIRTSLIAYEGDPGINDCINSFVYSILMLKPNINKRIGFFKRQKYKKNLIIQADRFGIPHIHTDIPNHLFEPLSEVKLYVSLEGVIIGINSYNIFLSLDGIVWKSYKINDLVGKDLSSKLSFVSTTFSTDDDHNYLSVSANNKTTFESSQIKFSMNFRFNFWDLYSSPIELELDCVE